MSVFTWIPDFGAEADKTPAVSTVRFGDGYEQRNQFGMNTQRQNWPLTFANREASEADEIDAFLTARGGAESFEWTPPDADEPLVFVCRQWRKRFQKYNLWTITATFEQVFDPA
jgi:phage-related protein